MWAEAVFWAQGGHVNGGVMYRADNKNKRVMYRTSDKNKQRNVQ